MKLTHALIAGFVALCVISVGAAVTVPSCVSSCDVNQDGAINVIDLQVVASHLNETATWTTTPTSTSTPTVQASSTAIATATSTPTVPSTPTPSSVPTATSSSTATATNTPSASGCTTNCGTPRFFCDSGTWAFCDDYRDVYCPVHCPFPDGLGQRPRSVSINRLSSTYPDGLADGYSDPAAAATGSFGNDQEHFHSNVEDGQFGMVVMRHHQPFDFAGREGHVHFEVDLKTSARRYVRVTLSPDLSRVVTDERQDIPRLPNAIDIWFRNGIPQIDVIRGGNVTEVWPPCNGCGPRYYGRENVRDLVDVYYTRTHVRLVRNGVTWVDVAIPDAGFDRAYVYLSQVSYNACKGWESEGFNVYGNGFECTAPAQVFHWDSVAWDGPVLADNSLTPAGSRDVIFNVRGAVSCSVAGVPASRVAPDQWGTWLTWRARLPVGAALSEGDVHCSWASGNGSTVGVVQAFEIVTR